MNGKQVWIVTRLEEDDAGPTERQIYGVYATAQQAYAVILRHILESHEAALELLDEGDLESQDLSPMHTGNVRFSLDSWYLNSGSNCHKGIYR